MSSTIQRRVEALEHAGTSGVEFILILRRVVKPGAQPGEATQAMLQGQHLQREAAESEAQFIERIRAHALANCRPGQRSVLVLMEESDLDL